MSQKDYTILITNEIGKYQVLLQSEPRDWRAREIQGIIKGLVEALKIYKMYGFDG